MATDGDGYLSAEVYQASGVLAEELGCSPDDALGRMTSLALAIGCTLDHLAAEILDPSGPFDDERPFPVP